jgi:hypothetical protein
MQLNSTGRGTHHTCRHIFLDVGANVGLNAHFLYNGTDFPKSLKMVPLMDQMFGRDRSHVCYRGFEPNMNHIDRHVSLRHNFKDKDMVIYSSPVGISNSSITFYYKNTEMEKKHNDWGFSSQVDPSQHAVKSVNLTAVNLTQIDFPSWLNALEPKDARILMKLDVEGSEFELLTALLFRGQLCNRIHTMTLEWHPRQCQRKWCAIKDKLPPILDLARSVKCSTRFLAMDDESYEDDRVSLHRGHSTGWRRARAGVRLPRASSVAAPLGTQPGGGGEAYVRGAPP